MRHVIDTCRREWLFLVLTAVTMGYFAIGKHDFEPRLAVGPVSVNQILQIVVAGTLVVLGLRGRLRPAVGRRTLALAVALVGLTASGLARTVNDDYALAKTLGLLVVVLPCLVLFGARDTDRGVRRVLTLWMLLGTGMMLLGLAALLAGRSPARLAVFGGGANVYARMVASGLLIAIGMHALGASRGRAWSMVRMALVAGFATALLFAGSKAVVLSLGAALVTRALYLRKPRTAAAAFAATIAFGCLPAVTHRFVENHPKDDGEVRMLRLPDTEDPQGSWGTRTRFYRESVALIGRNASWGVGTGNWGPEMGMGLGRNYPHNIVLELASEQGIPGLALAVAIALWTASLLRRAARAETDRALVSTLAALAVFWIANAQLSGDLIDNRSIWWPLLGLEIVLAMRPVREVQPIAALAGEAREIPASPPLVPEPVAAIHSDPVHASPPSRWS